MKMMGKELVVGQVEPNFNARIIIQKNFHGVMVNNKQDEFEKNIALLTMFFQTRV